jgi:sugar phosphate isomerase/epimerase
MGDYDLEISEFAVYNETVAALASLDSSRKNHALDNFKRCADIAEGLGAKIINFVSNWPDGLEAPTTGYPPHAIYSILRGSPYISPKNTLFFPKNFEWNKIWDNYVDSIKKAVAVSKEHGMRLALEGHCHVIVPNAEGLLRMADFVQDESFGFNFDTGWHFQQREHIPWTVYKLAGKIFHMHVRDGDGLLNYGIPPGAGIIDWEATIRALMDIGYDGYLSFEMGGLKDIEKMLLEGKAYLEQVIEKVKNSG